LRSIRREISTEDELSAARVVKRQKLKEKKMAEPKILGRHKYEAPPLEVNLSEEIAGNLRGLKVEGNSSTLLAFLAVRDSSLGYRLRQLDKAIPFMSAEVIIVKIQVTSCLPLVHSSVSFLFQATSYWIGTNRCSDATSSSRVSSRGSFANTS
jgi:Nop53 (60S ribosomal biogenesis)